MFQGPHERRGMQRKKKRANSCILMIGSNTCKSYARACACAHTFIRCELCHNITADDWIIRTAARNLGIKVCSGCILAADTWVICTEKVHDMYTEKLLAGYLPRNTLFHVASDLRSFGLILQTKFSRHILKRNTVCASFPAPTQGKIIGDVTLIAAHSFISSADSNNLPRHHTEAQPTCLHRRSQGPQRLAVISLHWTFRGLSGALADSCTGRKTKGQPCWNWHCFIFGATGAFGGCFHRRYTVEL